MRTPWRFVADLVSRKPKQYSHDGSPAGAPKTIALEYKGVTEEEKASLDATAVDGSAESGSEALVEASRPKPDTNPTGAGTAASGAAAAPAVTVGGEQPTGLADTQRAEEAPPASPGIETAKATTKAAPTQRKRVASIVDPRDPIGIALEQAPAVARGPTSFMDEMADLDVEVAALRRQLAKKLVEQNAQLRKMLARFDPR